MYRRTGTSQFSRLWNRTNVADVLAKHSPISQTQICEETGLSKATVSTIISELRKENIIKEVGKEESEGGRRQILLEINDEAGFVVGIDLGGTKMAGAVSNLNGDYLVKMKWPTEAKKGSATVLENLISFVKELIKKANLPDDKIYGVGVGIPGILAANGIVEWAPALNWKNLDLANILSSAIGIPVFVENDVNLLTLGEYWYGVGQGFDSMACLAIGTGIGAGLIINGLLYTGAHNAAGEVCNLLVDRSLLGKDFSHFGSLEMIASGPALARRYKEIINQKNINGREPSNKVNPDFPKNHNTSFTGAEEVFMEARENDPYAKQVIDEFSRNLSMAVIALTTVFDPELIVLGGGVSANADIFRDRIIELSSSVVQYMPQIEISTLGVDAGVMGAIAHTLHNTREELFRK